LKRRADLDGPKAAKSLFEIKATGICHTDAYTLDASTAKESFLRILA